MMGYAATADPIAATSNSQEGRMPARSGRTTFQNVPRPGLGDASRRRGRIRSGAGGATSAWTAADPHNLISGTETNHDPRTTRRGRAGDRLAAHGAPAAALPLPVPRSPLRTRV